jgi:hypothetical protein
MGRALQPVGPITGQPMERLNGQQATVMSDNADWAEG